MFDFNQEIDKEIKDLYSSIEEAKINMINFINRNYCVKGSDIIGYVFLGPPADMSWDGKILRFTINDYPPRTNSLRKSTYDKVRELWQGYIIQAYRNSELNLKFGNAHCLIKMYLPNKIIGWDVDNRTTSFIINALRYIHLIKDDDYTHLSYSVIGKISEKPKTEVSVCECQDIGLLFSNANNGKL